MVDGGLRKERERQHVLDGLAGVGRVSVVVGFLHPLIIEH
jgi:hypothetical protein